MKKNLKKLRCICRKITNNKNDEICSGLFECLFFSGTSFDEMEQWLFRTEGSSLVDAYSEMCNLINHKTEINRENLIACENMLFDFNGVVNLPDGTKIFTKETEDELNIIREIYEGQQLQFEQYLRFVNNCLKRAQSKIEKESK